MPIPTGTQTPTPSQGMTFDASPVTTATTVPAPANPAPSTTPDAGMTFDDAPVTSALAVPVPYRQVVRRSWTSDHIWQG
jgi:hypothetical protein